MGTMWLQGGEVILQDEADLETLAKLAGVSRSYRPHRGNGCQPNSYQFTHAGVNRAWHGEGQHRVGGVPQFDVFDPFGKEEKISGTCPFMCLVLKREQRQTKLTTALWYWQHCYWHHNWELLKLYRWHQQTIATALFYSGEQHQEMSLDRIFDMARSFAGKTVLSSNFLQHRKNCCLFFKTGAFLDVCWSKPLSHRLPTSHTLACIDKGRISGYWAHSSNWAKTQSWRLFQLRFVQEPQKKIFISFPWFDIEHRLQCFTVVP